MFNLKKTPVEIYSDFILDFSMNPFTGSLARVTNEESVRQSLISLFMTKRGERFYDTNKCSPILDSLFEPHDPLTIEMIRMKVGETLNYEPRAQAQDIQIVPNLDKNEYAVVLNYTILNIPNKVFSLEIPVYRVR